MQVELRLLYALFFFFNQEDQNTLPSCLKSIVFNCMAENPDQAKPQQSKLSMIGVYM